MAIAKNQTEKEMINIDSIVNKYNFSNEISDEDALIILSLERIETLKYIIKNPNRKFALALLNKIIEKRKIQNDIGNGDNIMFVCYILGKHKEIQDSLTIWKAKNVDFDAACYVDIQLCVFNGIKETIEYLKSINEKDAENALEHIVECENAGDFQEIEEYFSNENLPWWI